MTHCHCIVSFNGYNCIFIQLFSPSNARKLLKFSLKHGYTNITWELGNEPNSLMHQLGYKINARRLGRDFKKLRTLLNQFPQFRNSALVGPDVNQLRAQSPKAKVQKALKYLRNVYIGSRSKINKSSVLDAITWHHYYLNGHTVGANFYGYLIVIQHPSLICIFYEIIVEVNVS